MPLAWQNVPVVFEQGEDTKTDPKQVVQGKLLLLENAQLNSPKQLQKRAGFGPLPQEVVGSSTALVSVGQGLTAYEDELLVMDTDELYSFSEASQRWVEKGSLTSAEVTQFDVNRDEYNNDHQDGKYHPTGLSIYSWRDVGTAADGDPDVIGVKYSVVDTSTQQLLLEAVPVGAGVSWTGSGYSKCACFGMWMVVFYVTATHTLRATAIPVGNPTAPTDILVAGDINVDSPYFDVCASTDGTRLMFVYNQVGATLGVGYVTLALTSVVAPPLSTGNAVNQCVSIVGDLNANASPQKFFITYGGAGNLYFQVINQSLTSTTAETGLFSTGGDAVNASALYSTAAPTNPLNATVYATINGDGDSASYNFLIAQCSVVAGTPGAATTLARSVSLAGKPFVYPFATGGTNYILANYASGNNGIQNTYFLLDENGTVRAKLLALGCGGFDASGHVAETSNPGPTSYSWGLTIQDNLVSSVSAPAQQNPLFSQTGVESVTVNFFDSSVAYARDTLAETLHVTGGFLSMYDGARVVEHGFHVWPEQLSVTTGNPGDGNVYEYVGVYEWVDNQGNRHQSAPSIGFSVSSTDPIGISNPATVVFPTLRLTQKTGVALVVYRTEANNTQLYRVTDPGASYNLNDPTMDTISITDSVGEPTPLIQGQNLYTFGGVVENVSVPNCSAIDIFDNRMWVLPSDNRLNPWFSKVVTAGTPVEFSDLFTFPIDPRGGDITAMQSMDANQIFYKESSIYYTTGTGPDATGQQEAYQPASAPISTDVGCTDPRSVILMPFGQMFKSKKGIYLLDRGLEVHYIGADVAAFNQYTVVAATLVSSQNQVRFLLSNGVMLVYDYFMKQWGHRPLHQLVDSTIWQDSYVYLQSNGRVMVEDPTSFADAGEYYAMQVGTSWLSFAQISGYQRVKYFMLLGDYRSPHQLQINVAYDFDPTPTQVLFIDATAFDPGSWGDGDSWGSDEVWGDFYPAYQFRVNLTKQKCTSIQITIADVQTDPAQPPGEGFALSSLTFVVGVKSGVRKVGIERVFGGSAGVPTGRPGPNT